ncbi:hypothetical protein MJO28_015563 [Puccinia striiformis f. sp. tritici]|uniref:Uncharacterized protein n=1 Tax=Puccinia striiformis f. sp. tritici TaxID=168172 RepID=A0ACC0DRX2_9BASI|nr:hypothetical protein MJO28_015563 [Puccinia striiformis f. sp. tritici]
MYSRFFVAVVLILQTMASAAPSSPIEAGVKVRRGGKRIPTCKWDDPNRCDVTPQKRWVDWPMAMFRGPSFLESPTLLHFPQRDLAYFSSFFRKRCTLYVCYRSIPENGHTF